MKRFHGSKWAWVQIKQSAEIILTDKSKRESLEGLQVLAHGRNIITAMLSLTQALKTDTPRSMSDLEQVFNVQDLHFHTHRMAITTITITMGMIPPHLQDWNGYESRHTEKAGLSA